MPLAERGEFINLLRGVDMSLSEYENYRKLAEPSPAPGSGKATIDMYNKYRWPGPCCFPNHPAAFGAASWNCATVVSLQPSEENFTAEIDVDAGGTEGP